jgi:hypothetical protein
MVTIVYLHGLLWYRWPFSVMIYLLEIASVHSYVELPEGISYICYILHIINIVVSCLYFFIAGQWDEWYIDYRYNWKFGYVSRSLTVYVYLHISFVFLNMSWLSLKMWDGDSHSQPGKKKRKIGRIAPKHAQSTQKSWDFGGKFGVG